MSQRSIRLAVEARRAYDGYLRLCVERPELATYTNASQLKGFSNPEKLWENFATGPSRYVWFVAYMLKVFDDLIRYDVGEEWDDALVAQLQFHGPTLTAIWHQHWKPIYSNELGKLVARALKAAK